MEPFTSKGYQYYVKYIIDNLRRAYENSKSFEYSKFDPYEVSETPFYEDPPGMTKNLFLTDEMLSDVPFKADLIKPRFDYEVFSIRDSYIENKENQTLIYIYFFGIDKSKKGKPRPIQLGSLQMSRKAFENFIVNPGKLPQNDIKNPKININGNSEEDESNAENKRHKDFYYQILNQL